MSHAHFAGFALYAAAYARVAVGDGMRQTLFAQQLFKPSHPSFVNPLFAKNGLTQSLPHRRHSTLSPPDERRRGKRVHVAQEADDAFKTRSLDVQRSHTSSRTRRWFANQELPVPRRSQETPLIRAAAAVPIQGWSYTTGRDDVRTARCV